MTLLSGTGPGVILIGLILALPLVIIVPFVMLALYKRSLHRLMRQDSVPADSSPEPTSSASPDQVTTAPSRPRAVPPLTIALARHRRMRCAIIYAAGGGCSAAALTLGLLGEAGIHKPLAFLTILAVNLWPVLLSLSHIFGWRRQLWLRAALAYLCVLAAFAVLQHARGAKGPPGQILLLFVLLNGPSTVFYKAVSLNRIRQVGPTLLPFCLAIVEGPQVLLHLGATRFSMALVFAHAAMGLHLGNLQAIAFVTVLTMLFMALIGWFLATLLVVLYRAQQISDQTLLLDSLWLIFVGTQALFLLTRTGNETGSGAAWIAIAFPLYLVAVHLGLRLARRQARPQTTRASLLVLRAFALQQKAEAVFQPLTGIWRYLGPIRLIGAPDLANTTVEPASFLEFARGRLSRLFLKSPAQLEARLHEPEPFPDPDSRFRVFDFFCFDNVWQLAVSRLIERSDVILADFRGLSQGRRGGCEWEIHQIGRTVGLAKCVFLLDPPPKSSLLNNLEGEDKTDDDHYLKSILGTTPPPVHKTLLDGIEPTIIHGEVIGDQMLEELLSALLAGLSPTGTSSPAHSP